MNTINKSRFVTLHFGRNSMNDTICVLHLGKENYFKNPCKYPTESFPISVKALANPELVIEALEDEDNFGRKGFSIRLSNSQMDIKSLANFANCGEVKINLVAE